MTNITPLSVTPLSTTPADLSNADPVEEPKYTNASQPQMLFHTNMCVADYSKGKTSGLSEDEIVEVYDAIDEVITFGDDKQKELVGNFKDYMDDLIETYGKEGEDIVVSYSNYLELNGDGISASSQYEKGSIQQHMFKNIYGHKVETGGQLESIFHDIMCVHDLSEGKQSGLTQEEIDDFYLAANTVLEIDDREQNEFAGNLKDYMDDLIETYGKEGEDIVVSYDDYLELNGNDISASSHYEKGSIQKYAKEAEQQEQQGFFSNIFNNLKSIFTK